MGYLLIELLLFLVVAFLIGLLIGYWVWGGRGTKVVHLEQDLINARKALEDCQSARQRLEREDSANRTKLTDAQARITSLEEALANARQEAADAAAAAPPPPVETPAPPPPPAEPMGIVAAVSQPDEEAVAKLATSPFLDKPVGEPDNLRLIKGVGPKLSNMLHAL
ncbi:MAG: hypothetical protein AAF141_13655, partial [Pseudomonadota bacterium]